MAVSLNNYAKYNTTNGNSIIGTMKNALPFKADNANNSYVFLYVYLSTRAYSLANGASSTGSAISYQAGPWSATNFTQSGNNIIFSSGGGSVQVTPSASGTLAWFSLYENITGATIVSDSISLIGDGGILQCSTLSVTSGTPITINFSLSIS